MNPNNMIYYLNISLFKYFIYMLFKTKRFQLSTNIIRHKENKQNNDISADKLENANKDRVKVHNMISRIIYFTILYKESAKIYHFVLVFNHV